MEGATMKSKEVKYREAVERNLRSAVRWNLPKYLRKSEAELRHALGIRREDREIIFNPLWVELMEKRSAGMARITRFQR
jgi:hypothetical protein